MFHQNDNVDRMFLDNGTLLAIRDTYKPTEKIRIHPLIASYSNFYTRVLYIYAKPMSVVGKYAIRMNDTVNTTL